MSKLKQSSLPDANTDRSLVQIARRGSNAYQNRDDGAQVSQAFAEELQTLDYTNRHPFPEASEVDLTQDPIRMSAKTPLHIMIQMMITTVDDRIVEAKINAVWQWHL